MIRRRIQEVKDQLKTTYGTECVLNARICNFVVYRSVWFIMELSTYGRTRSEPETPDYFAHHGSALLAATLCRKVQRNVNWTHPRWLGDFPQDEFVNALYWVPTSTCRKFMPGAMFWSRSSACLPEVTTWQVHTQETTNQSARLRITVWRAISES